MHIGIQIFGCLALCKRDPAGFFRTMKGMGYGDIEPCIAFGLDVAPAEGSLLDAVWKPSEMEMYTRLLGENGLTLTSAHVFADNPPDCLDEMRETARRFGIKAYVLNCPENIADNYAEFAAMCGVVAEAMAASGVEVWLHNHYREIRAKADGVTVYERILALCGGKLGAQPDVGWALYGGEEPVALLRRMQPYLRAVHYKDMKKGYAQLPPERAFAGLGQGALDVRAVYDFAKALGLPQLVDQDSSDGDLLADLEASAGLLRSFA